MRNVPNYMKYLSFLCLVTLALCSCGNRSTEIFSMTNEAEFNIPAGLDNVLTHIFVIENLPSTFEAATNQNGFTVDQISKVNSSTAEFIGKFESVDYSNIERVAVNLVDPTGEFPTREIYFQEVIDINHSGPLQLFGSLSDVKDLLSQPTHNIEIELQFRAPTTLTLENRFIYNFVAFDNE